MRPITLTQNLDNASATKVALAQTALINAALTLTAAATSGIDSSGAARILLITTTEDDSSGNLTIVGTDADGNAISEVIAMPSSTTKPSVKAYKTVSSITTSIAITANISIGTTGTVLSSESRVIPLEFYSRTGATVAIEVGGTVNVTIQETFDDILGLGTANAVWFSPSALSSKTSNTVASLDIGATGMRVQINSYSSSATVTARIISVESDKG